MKRMGITAVAFAVLGGGLAGCSQERVSCQTARGDFAVKLFLKSGTGECAANPGGVYGVSTYNYQGSDGRADPARISVAIQSEDLGVVVSDAIDRLGDFPDAANHPYAKGDFTSPKPDGEDLCQVPTLVKAEQNIPALDAIPADPEDPESEEISAEPARSFSYEWSDVKFLVTEAATGTQFIGALKYTVDGCTAEYEAWGLYPAVYCTDDDGNPVDALCDAVANPDAGIPVGSGINPDFKVSCDATLGLCMLKDKPPTQ